MPFYPVSLYSNCFTSDLSISYSHAQTDEAVLFSVCKINFFACFSGEVILTGEGHDDWLSDCDFHPRY